MDMSTLQCTMLFGPWVTGVVFYTLPGLLHVQFSLHGKKYKSGEEVLDFQLVPVHGALICPQSRHRYSSADQPWKCKVHEILLS